MVFVQRYSAYFAYATLGFFCSLFFVTFIAAQILKRYLRYKAVNYIAADFVETKPPIKKKRLARFLDGVAAFSSALIFVVLSTFSYLPWYFAALLASAWLILYWGIKSSYFVHCGVAYRCCSPTSGLYEDMEEESGYSMVVAESPFAKKNINPKQKFFRHTVRQGIPMIFVCGIFFFLAWASADVCVSLHPLSVSTRVSRSIAGDPCANKDPCHIYAMVGRDMSKEIIVHWHASRPYSNPILLFDTTSHASSSVAAVYSQRVTAVSYHMAKLEVPRYVYYANLVSLLPDTTYFVRVAEIARDGGVVMVGSEWNFKTAPTASSNGTVPEFHFVAGGDMGRTKVTQDLTELAGKTDPLFAAIGGDLSYDNGIAACYSRWDAWFDLLENYLFSKKDSRLVPLIVSIGNHEAGNFYAPPDAFTFYKAYFVQEPIAVGTDPNTMPTYQSHVVGNLLLLSMDSFVYADPAGAQSDWLKTQMQQSYNSPVVRWRSAQYHAPQWPSVRSLNDSVSKACREAWGPIFDQFNMDIGFENHDHAYKRTKLMRGGKPVAANGTLFVGDGSWGVEDGFRRHVSHRFYTDIAIVQSFFFNISVSHTFIHGWAINTTGHVFDTFNLSK